MFTTPSAPLRNVMKRPLLTLAFTLAAALQAAPAFAQVPGTPGMPQAGRPLWIEDFSAGSPLPGGAVPLEMYRDSNGMSYTNDLGWKGVGTNQCNGWILNSGTAIPSTDTGCSAPGGAYPGIGSAAQPNAWFFLQAMAAALGEAKGMTPTEAANNNVLGLMTNPGTTGTITPISSPVQLQIDSVITSASADPAIEGHYYIATALFAAVHCQNDAYATPHTWIDAQETIHLMDSSSLTDLSSSSVISPCAGAPATATTYREPMHNTPIYTAEGATDVWQAPFSGADLGIKITNSNTSTAGNDVAIDNLQIVDVTPQLDESFLPTSVSVGQTTTLTFTITNTDDLLTKSGWSFKETLPPGLTVAATPNVTTNCTYGAVAPSPPSGAATLTITGDLTAGQASCTVSVDVTSATAATYTNDAGNLTSLNGLWRPNPAQVTFSDSGGGGGGADMQALVVSGPTPASPGSPDMTVVSKCVNNGPSPAANPTCNVAVTGAAGSTTCTPPPSSLATGDAITCTTTYTKGASAVTVTTTAGSATSDPNMANNIAAVPPVPLNGGGAAIAVPTGKSLFWLLLLALAATAWPALARRASR